MTLFPPVLQCPEADQGAEHVVSYAMNWLVGIYPWREVGDPPGSFAGALTRPTRQTQLLKETAILWDTGILRDWLMDPRWRLGADIDNQRIAFAGAITPQYRFYTIKDVFAHVPPGIHGQNKPILLNVAQYTYYNREPKSVAEELFPYQGNLRFRHQKQTACNVGFSDGSVRQFTCKMNPDKSVKSHDTLRRYFMIKWPPGVRPNPGVPY
jgi:prepilin-type processing-associated H-X9-DG protein